MFGLNLTLIASLISAGIAGAAGFGLAWQLRTGTIAEIKLEQANERISLQRAARQNTERLVTQYAAAQSNATNRSVVLRADAVSAGNAGNGLRIKTADAVRTASSDPAACADRAAALGVVFNEAVTELTALAASADRHASDAQTLIEAWPK